MTRRGGRVAAFVFLWMTIPPGVAPGAAQDTGAQVADVRGAAALERVEELTRAGRTEEARVVLSDWWDADRAEASRDDVQRGIWLRGLLTVDPDQAALDFRRLVVGYPTGPYTARALARIAGAAAAAGDRAEAARAYETLVREHRGTPEAERAGAWLAGGPEATDAVPTQSDTVDGAAGGSEIPVGAPAPTPSTASSSAGRYTVQLGAFATMTRALGLVERIRRAGLEPRLVRVPGSELTRVRLGRFALAREAEDLQRRVVEMGFEALVSDDAVREEPAGGG